MNIENLKKIDISIVICVLLLCVIGALNVFSTTYFPEKEASGLFFNQLIYYGVGFILMMVISSINFSFLNRFFVQVIVLIVAVGLLVAVLFIGEEVLGATRWINIGGFTIQPSEFAKIGMILLSSYILSFEKPVKKYKNRLISFFLKYFDLLKIFVSLVFLGLFVVLIISQNSLGNSLLLIGIWGIIFISYFPFNFKYIAFVLSAGLGIFLSLNILSFSGDYLLSNSLNISLLGLGLFLLVIYTIAKLTKVKFWMLILVFFLMLPIRFGVEYSYENILKDYQRVRIETFLNPESDQAASWNKDQARIALGSGKIFGKGFLKGTHTNYKFLPFSYNDFAFASLGEQFGFVGLLTVVSLFIVLLNRIVNVARVTKNQFGRLIVFGVSGMIFLNMFQHMGMNVGILPITGVPLPFVSYGGSATLVMMMGIGLVLSVSVYGERFSNVRKHAPKYKAVKSKVRLNTKS